MTGDRPPVTPVAVAEVWRREAVESPCIRLCVVDPASRLCLGCYRSIEEIAAGKGKKRVWHSNKSVADNVKAGATRGGVRPAKKAGGESKGAGRGRKKDDAALPDFVPPSLATSRGALSGFIETIRIRSAFLALTWSDGSTRFESFLARSVSEMAAMIATSSSTAAICRG